MSQVFSSCPAPSRSGRPTSDPAGVTFEGHHVRFMARPGLLLVKGVAPAELLPSSPWQQGVSPAEGQAGGTHLGSPDAPAECSAYLSQLPPVVPSPLPPLSAPSSKSL